MSRKPRFKLQRRNSGDYFDQLAHGNKRWLNICAQPANTRGWVQTFEQATQQYHEISELYPTETYRIVEKR